MRRLSSVHPQRTPGFTLLEFLVVFATFLVLIAGVFSQIEKFQQVYKAEETKVDASQESRTMLDEIAREVRLAGYPGPSLFDPTTLANTATVVNNSNVAAGLVKVSNYELWFEGDIDADNTVDVVHYMLMDNGGNPVTAASSCPCTLKRSQVPKTANAPLAQNTNYTSDLSNILNSGLGNPDVSVGLTIAGTTNGVSNNVLYSAYKNAPVFTALNAAGNPVGLPIDITNLNISSIKSIVITVNTLTVNSDLRTKAPLPYTGTVTAKVNN